MATISPVTTTATTMVAIAIPVVTTTIAGSLT
jgi:hypothetical protein